MDFLGQIGNFLHTATAPAVNYFQQNIEKPVANTLGNIGGAIQNEVQQAPQQIHPLVNFVQQAPQVFGQNLQNIKYQLPNAYQSYVQPQINQVAKTPIIPFLPQAGNLGQLLNPNDTSMPLLGGIRQANQQNYLKGVASQPLMRNGIKQPDYIRYLQSNQGTSDLASGLLGGGANDFEAIAKQFASKLDKPTVDLLGRFAEMVDQNPKQDLGVVGQQVHSLATQMFGKQAANLSNTQLRNYFDVVLGKIGQQANKAGLGLSIGDIRAGRLLPSGQTEQPLALPPGELNPQAAKDFFTKTGIVPAVKNTLQAGKKVFNLGDTPPIQAGIASSIKEPGILQKVFGRASNLIASQGQSGQLLAKSLEDARNTGETLAGSLMNQLPTVKQLSKNEFVNMVDTIEGKAQPLTPKIAQAAQETKAVLDQVKNKANDLGVLIGGKENYFPHMFDQKMFEGKGLQQSIQHLVQSGQAPDANTALNLIRHAQDIVRNRRQGNLETERLVNLPGYKKDPEALFNYLDQASHRIGQVQHFGLNDATALSHINNVIKEGGNGDMVRKLFDISVGAKNYDKGIANTLIKGNAVTKLGLSAIGNATQSVNTGAVAGLGRTAKAMLQHLPGVMSKEDRNFIERAGVAIDTTLNDVKQGMAGTKFATPFFNTVERFNRGVAALAGRNFAIDLAKQAAKGSTSAIEALNKMGITDFQNGLSEADQIKAARDIVKRTQFKVDPQDLPGWATSPWGRLVSQFRTFSYNQTGFFKKELLDPALKGNVAPLARFIAVGIPVGYGASQAKGFLKDPLNKQPNQPTTLTNNPITQGFNQAGGAGFAQDLLYGVLPNQFDQTHGQFDASKYAINTAGNLFGPTVGTGAKILKAGGDAMNGKFQPGAKLAVQQIPVLGPSIANTFMSSQPGANAPGAPKVDTSSITDTGNNLTPVEKAKIGDAIKQLEAQEKQIKADNGSNFLGLQIGGTNDQQKNDQLSQLEQQKKALQSQLKPKEDYLSQQLTGNINVDEALLSKQSGQITTQENQTLKAVLDGKLDPQTGDQKLAQLKQQQKDIAAKLKDIKLSLGELKGKKLSIKGVSFKSSIAKTPKPITYKKPSTKGVKLPMLKANLKTLSYKQKPFKLK